MKGRESVMDYTGLSEDEYTQLRELSRKEGKCVICNDPRGNNDDFCSFHRGAFDDWCYINEILRKKLENPKAVEMAQMIVKQFSLPIWAVIGIFDIIMEKVEEDAGSEAVISA